LALSKEKLAVIKAQAEASRNVRVWIREMEGKGKRGKKKGGGGERGKREIGERERGGKERGDAF
jgi:hypothetical protein